jgi:hypothetical protein
MREVLAKSPRRYSPRRPFSMAEYPPEIVLVLWRHWDWATGGEAVEDVGLDPQPRMCCVTRRRRKPGQPPEPAASAAEGGEPADEGSVGDVGAEADQG